MPAKSPLETVSSALTRWVATSAALVSAFALVVLWALSGPFLHYSETWQLAINTVTTVVTFLMTFLIQRTTAKESQAIQLKLDELLQALDRAHAVGLEERTEQEVESIKTEVRGGTHAFR